MLWIYSFTRTIFLVMVRVAVVLENMMESAARRESVFHLRFADLAVTGGMIPVLKPCKCSVL